jgi:pimeloyl-ACP methyl ester carboxylesterase
MTLTSAIQRGGEQAADKNASHPFHVNVPEATRLYWERKLGFFTPKGVKISVAASAFPDELYQAPRSWAEQAYPNLIHYNKLPKGGHFAAWEQPKFLSEELRAGFKSLRK